MNPPSGRPTARYVQEIVDAVLAPMARPGRALLVLCAYLLGVAALVAGMGAAQSTTSQVVTRLTQAGSTQLQVYDSAAHDQPWTPSDPRAAGAWEHSLAGAARLGGIEGVEAVFPVRTFAASANRVSRLRHGGPSEGSPYGGKLMVTRAGYLAERGLRAAAGRVDSLDAPWGGRSVVLGSAAAGALGVAGSGPGIVIWLNGRPIDVVGVLEPSSDAVADDCLYFSPGVLPVLSGQLEASWWVRATPGYAEPLHRGIPLALAPESPGRIAVSVVAQLSDLQQGINADLGALLSVIGWVILVLSGLTASTTMLLSVQHRGAEIALRRAMGASRASIWRLFAYEGLATGTAGGILGTAAGMGLAWAIARFTGWPLSFGLPVAVSGIALGAVCGVLASIVPACYAAWRDPAGILRVH